MEKTRRITATNAEGIPRLIQFISSPKTEPFKLWLARVGSERIGETIDPELTIDRTLATYLKDTKLIQLSGIMRSEPIACVMR